MVAAVFTHRLGYPKPLLAEAALDVTNAIDYICDRAGSFNADPGRIALVAWSGGGPLLSIAMRQQPSLVRCLLAFYAYLDIQRPSTHAVAANLLLTFMNHPAGEHGFDNQNDDDRSREIIRAALEFLQAHLGLTPKK